ncbi:unnamed protein product [Amaranthus hypochondriacus]
MPPMDSTFSDFTLNVSENCIMSDKLERAVLVEYEGNVDAKQAVSLAVATDIPFVSASSVSPFKLLLFFDSVDEMMTAIAEDSPLRTVFTRMGIDFAHRYARVQLEWESGCCTVLVKEIGNGDGMSWQGAIVGEQCTSDRVHEGEGLGEGDVQGAAVGSCDREGAAGFEAECDQGAAGFEAECNQGAVVQGSQGSTRGQPVVALGLPWYSDDDPIIPTQSFDHPVVDLSQEAIVVALGLPWYSDDDPIIPTQSFDHPVVDLSQEAILERGDPMLVEIVPWASRQSSPVRSNGAAGGNVLGVPKRSRGRPRKRGPSNHVESSEDVPLLQAAEEVSETWQTTQLLGVSSMDEPAVLSHIRKSKRISLMAQGLCPHG